MVRFGGMAGDDMCVRPPEDLLGLGGRLLAALASGARSDGVGASSSGPAPDPYAEYGYREDDLCLPAAFSCRSVRVIGYPSTGHLLEHQDMYMGHTLSLSLGAACTFRYGCGYRCVDCLWKHACLCLDVGVHVCVFTSVSRTSGGCVCGMCTTGVCVCGGGGDSAALFVWAELPAGIVWRLVP
jgi:hypothetical protein